MRRVHTLVTRHHNFRRMETHSDIEQLYRRYLANDLSEEELNSFLNLLNEANSEEIVSRLMDATWSDMSAVDLPSRAKSRTMRSTSFAWYMAAASIIALVLVGGYLFFNSADVAPSVAKEDVKPFVNDVAPGGDKAVLTLADGRRIVLDSAADGAITKQGGIIIIKLGGQLTYDQQVKTTEVLFNTITTPRGGQYQLELADGTKVWLNAASSLRFPTAFTGNNRSVELTGEGYFEVAHNANKPFHVQVRHQAQDDEPMDVEVMGTHFNINSYNNEPELRTTLLEGKVSVTKGKDNVVLLPGQQAVVRRGAADIMVLRNADIDEAIAWKEGRFQFGEGTDIKAIMRQLERWYDVDAEINGSGDTRIGGNISRAVPMSQVLKMLEMTGSDIKFRMEGRRITVTAN